MANMQIKKVTEVRSKFQEVIDKVHYTKVPTIISKNGKPWVMIQPLPEEDKELKRIIKKK